MGKHYRPELCVTTYHTNATQPCRACGTVDKTGLPPMICAAVALRGHYIQRKIGVPE